VCSQGPFLEPGKRALLYTYGRRMTHLQPQGFMHLETVLQRYRDGSL
jgi:hypothetical protein